MASTGLSVHTPITPKQMESQTNLLCDSLSKHRPEDTQALFGDLHKMATAYYQGALSQASRSFAWALGFAVVGTTIVLLAVGTWVISALRPQPSASGQVRQPAPPLRTNLLPHLLVGLAGVIVQVISGLNFYLYRKATAQFELFHVCLERMGRYLMANSVCANIRDEGQKDQARVDLIKTMANAPMLPAECVRNLRDDTPQIKESPIKSSAEG
jgi:hypothetical protein